MSIETQGSGRGTRHGYDAEVIIVGGGPAGATCAGYLAAAGVDVMLVEKTAYPREKVCGDGLTPRAVRELITLGIPHEESDGWIRNKGLRIIAGDTKLHLPWPQTPSFPDYGLVMPRKDFDHALAKHAVRHGATLRESLSVTGPIIDDTSGLVVGVTAKNVDERGRKVGDEVSLRAPLVIAADGNSSRLGSALGVAKRDDRPLGVAVRTYFESPRHDDDWLESWLELWDGERDNSNLLPGYGWVFGVGDGTSNVGLGILNSSAAFGKVDYRELLMRWVSSMPKEWQFAPEHQIGEIRGAALPMGFNRTPHYIKGMLLVGDSGGMVNPFNGEGIAYAMEAARLAADVVVHSRARSTEAGRQLVLASYPNVMKDALGGYYRLGKHFTTLIGNPHIMKALTKYGLPHPRLMRFTLKMMANLVEPRGGDFADRVISQASRITPAA